MNNSEINCFLCEEKINSDEYCYSLGRESTYFGNFLRFHIRCFEAQSLSNFDTIPSQGIPSAFTSYLILTICLPSTNSISESCLDTRLSKRITTYALYDVIGNEILDLL